MKFFVALICVFVAAYAAEDLVDDPEVQLPTSFNICSRSDPKLNACIKDNLDRIIPELADGYPTLGLPTYDPFETKRSTYTFKQNDIYGILHAKNAKAIGISKASVKNVKAKFTEDEAKLEVSIYIPHVTIDGYYKGEGRYNALRVNSKGYFNITMHDIETTWKFSGKTVERNGETYMKMDKFDMEPEVGKMKVFATGLFPDEELNRFAIDFVNSHWQVMYKSMLPGSRVSWEPLMLDGINKVFLRVPYRRLLKE